MVHLYDAAEGGDKLSGFDASLRQGLDEAGLLKTCSARK
jgi:hypothetical protein